MYPLHLTVKSGVKYSVQRTASVSLIAGSGLKNLYPFYYGRGKYYNKLRNYYKV